MRALPFCRCQLEQALPYPPVNKPLTSNYLDKQYRYAIIALLYSARFLSALRTMPARHAVPLTPSKSVRPLPRPSYRQSAPVTPLFSALAKSVQPSHFKGFRFPLFSYTYRLFCTCQKLNPFLFTQFRTLCQKHPGGGWALRHLKDRTPYLPSLSQSRLGREVCFPPVTSHESPACHQRERGALAARIMAAASQGASHA